MSSYDKVYHEQKSSVGLVGMFSAEEFLLRGRKKRMDSNNWRPAAQGVEQMAIDAGDWRSQLQQDSRQRIVNKM
ncbi:unnamed protein product [Ilex paraguariensis]|uniref:Uncharacterized protein n=1 Tax=Ilex paraguariensis TaxID=185542 RepID=A0ABC8RNB8_9AQUA